MEIANHFFAKYIQSMGLEQFPKIPQFILNQQKSLTFWIFFLFEFGSYLFHPFPYIPILQYLSSLPFQHHTSQLGKWQVAQRGTVAQCFKSLDLKSVDLKSNRSGQGVKGNKNLKVKKGGISSLPSLPWRCQVSVKYVQAGGNQPLTNFREAFRKAADFFHVAKIDVFQKKSWC